MDLLERAPLLDELASVLAATVGGGRVVLVAGEEGILYATLDLDAALARRRLFDPVGHYNRPDVFRLVVDDRPKPHLVSLAQD